MILVKLNRHHVCLTDTRTSEADKGGSNSRCGGFESGSTVRDLIADVAGKEAPKVQLTKDGKEVKFTSVDGTATHCILST